MRPFVHSSIVFCLLTILHNQRSMSSNLFVFQTWGAISSKPAVFLFLIFFKTVLNSSPVNCSSFIYSWSMISRGFPYWFLKYSFHFWSFSEIFLSAFNFALNVLILPLTWFTVCHANHNCLSLTKFPILFI